MAVGVGVVRSQMFLAQGAVPNIHNRSVTMAPMAVANGSLGSLAFPLKPDVALYVDDLPDSPEAFRPKDDTEAVFLEVLGRDRSQRVARKPEEILREDPMPSLHVKAKESCKESVTVKTVKNEDFYRQDSKKTPRSSYFTYELPEGLPDNECASPNRILHEAGQEAVMNFLLDVNKSPKRLKKDVYKRRGESEPSFFDHFGKLNFVKRVGAYWSSESESSGEWR